jgi:hypothetical protein
MNTIFENIRTLKRQLLPNDRMILFGSQAKGDPDSDWEWNTNFLIVKNMGLSNHYK